jgi:translation initiation factor IF-3
VANEAKKPAIRIMDTGKAFFFSKNRVRIHKTSVSINTVRTSDLRNDTS